MENSPLSCQPPHRRRCYPGNGPAGPRPELRCLAGACSPQTAIARAAPESLSPLVKKVLPAVVNIAVTETVSGGEVLSA